jgi:hypothetical protein
MRNYKDLCQNAFAESTTNQYQTVFFNQLGNIQWVIFLALKTEQKLSEDHVDGSVH